MVVTGNGLKDTESALRTGGEPRSVRPDLGDVVAFYSESERN